MSYIYNKNNKINFEKSRGHSSHSHDKRSIHKNISHINSIQNLYYSDK